jgi:hypothetical protein
MQKLLRGLILNGASPGEFRVAADNAAIHVFFEVPHLEVYPS